MCEMRYMNYGGYKKVFKAESFRKGTTCDGACGAYLKWAQPEDGLDVIDLSCQEGFDCIFELNIYIDDFLCLSCGRKLCKLEFKVIQLIIHSK